MYTTSKVGEQIQNLQRRNIELNNHVSDLEHMNKELATVVKGESLKPYNYHVTMKNLQDKIRLLEDRLSRIHSISAPDNFVSKISESKQYFYLEDAFRNGNIKSRKYKHLMESARELSDMLDVPYFWICGKYNSYTYFFDKDVLRFLVYLYDRKIDVSCLSPERAIKLKRECDCLDPHSIKSLNPEIYNEFDPDFSL